MSPELSARLPEGKRHTDPPEQGFRYRLKLAISKYPVLVGVTLALIVASVALFLVLSQQSQLAGQNARIKRQADQLQREKVSRATLAEAANLFCRRLQIERDRSNRAQAIIYLTLGSSASRERQLARSGANPNPATHRRSALILGTLASYAQWTPPTDCKQAFGDPTHYRNPTPKNFTVPVAAHFIPKAAKLLLEATK